MNQIIKKFLPFLTWFEGFSGEKLRADFIGGLTVALVLVPQSMAYAQLAGLPAYYGLYAAFLPPMMASLFGSSYQLATGPVAIVSLMTSTALAPLATAGSESYIAYAILLALCVGIFQLLLGVLKLGLVVNFLSHPVVNGFTNAAAIIIASSQLSKLFGVYVDSAEHHYETIYRVVEAAVHYTHWPTLGMAMLSFAIMIGLKRVNPKIPNVLVAVALTTLVAALIGFEHNTTVSVDRIKSPEIRETFHKYNEAVNEVKTKSDERISLGKKFDDVKKKSGKKSVEAERLHEEVVILNLQIEKLNEEAHEHRHDLRWKAFTRVSTDAGEEFYLKGEAPEGAKTDGRTWRIKLSNKPADLKEIKFMGGGAVVGVIPQGLPKIGVPKIDIKIMLTLLPMAVIISLLGFMEAISIAKAMAAKTGQRLDQNQELVGQGLANIIGSFGKSYAVSGSFSRSAVNLQAGAQTGLSNVISSCVVIVVLLFFTKYLYHLPQAVLASIIMMAVIGLVNIKGFIHTWETQWFDGLISIITFVTTLVFAPHLHNGIVIGVGLSLVLHMFRSMKPDIHILAKHPDGSFRCTRTHGLKECEHIAVIRFSGSLFFVNVSYLENVVLEEISRNPNLKHILIVGNGINELDASGEELLSILVERVREAGYDISFSGLNESVLAVMKRTHLYEKIGEDHLFRSVAAAMVHIHEPAHRDSKEPTCPLKEVFPVALKESPRGRILLVDDEKDFVQLLSKRLESRGIEIATAAGGREALDLSRKQPFDVVLLDIDMPDMDGFQVMKKLKDRDRDVQVIFVTGKATIESGVEAMKLGACDLVQKPIEMDALMAKIKEARKKRMVAVERHSEEVAEHILEKHGWED